MRSRVIACRQRLRRIRAAQRSPGDIADGQPRLAAELSLSTGEQGSIVESAGLLPDAQRAGVRQVGRHR
ncbi:MAG TPA: hypothetical protein VGC89_20465 [Pyrinomonadaceae bacterium]